MKFILEFEIDNDAFYPDPAPETARILHLIAALVETNRDEGSVRDVNGNRIGRFAFEK